MTDGRLMRSMLLDFYGELLTERQRECYDLHYNDDLSLAEIAEQSGVSRQCVWDNIRRAEASLQEIESKTGLIRRFSETQDALDAIAEKLGTLCGMTEGEAQSLAKSALSDVLSLKTEE